MDSCLEELTICLVDSETSFVKLLEDCFEMVVVLLLVFAMDKDFIHLTHDSFYRPLSRELISLWKNSGADVIPKDILANQKCLKERMNVVSSCDSGVSGIC